MEPAIVPAVGERQPTGVTLPQTTDESLVRVLHTHLHTYGHTLVPDFRIQNSFI